MNYLIIFLTLLFSLSTTSQAQQLLLTPRLVNYQVRDISASSQNWSITQDKNGVLFFANNKGVIEFDGSRWKLHTLPNKEIVKSVYYSADNKLYVGSFEELGYFSRTEHNTLEYHSLKPLLYGYKFQNDEIWNIVSNNGKIYFQYFSSLFIYDGKTMTVSKNIAPLNLFKHNNQLYSQIIDKGFNRITNGVYEQILDRHQYGNDDIVAMCSLERDKALFVTRNQGIFEYNLKTEECQKWENEVNEELKAVTANRAIMTKDSVLVIGSLTNGIYALNKSGKLLWKSNVASGLSNNTILGLFCDSDNNIWVGLDNGIAYIHHNSSISMLAPNLHNIGMVYDILFTENDLYVATNQGLYFYKNHKTPALIPGTEGQTWSITQIDNQLICGHNSGSYEVREGKIVKQISDITGAYNIMKCTIYGQEILLQSTYTYLIVYKKDAQGKWIYSNIIKDFSQPLMHIEIDHSGYIWVKHKYRGIYRIKLDEKLEKAIDVKFYNKRPL